MRIIYTYMIYWSTTVQHKEDSNHMEIHDIDMRSMTVAPANADPSLNLTPQAHQRCCDLFVCCLPPAGVSEVGDEGTVCIWLDLIRFVVPFDYGAVRCGATGSRVLGTAVCIHFIKHCVLETRKNKCFCIGTFIVFSFDHVRRRVF
jgi:hypothetical protein